MHKKKKGVPNIHSEENLNTKAHGCRYLGNPIFINLYTMANENIWHPPNNNQFHIYHKSHNKFMWTPWRWRYQPVTTYLQSRRWELNSRKLLHHCFFMLMFVPWITWWIICSFSFCPNNKAAKLLHPSASATVSYHGNWMQTSGQTLLTAKLLISQENLPPGIHE